MVNPYGCMMNMNRTTNNDRNSTMITLRSGQRTQQQQQQVVLCVLPLDFMPFRAHALFGVVLLLFFCEVSSAASDYNRLVRMGTDATMKRMHRQERKEAAE